MESIQIVIEFKAVALRRSCWIVPFGKHAQVTKILNSGLGFSSIESVSMVL